MYQFDDWHKHWANDELPWTCGLDDDWFIERHAELVSRYRVDKEGRCFVPLCGNTKVVPFLYSQGASVTALDFVAEALADLRQRYFGSVTFEMRALPGGGKCWSSNRLELVEQDFFIYQSSEPYDFVYDRGSFVALEPELRRKYVEIVTGLVRTGGIVYLAASDFDDGALPGPPFPATVADIKNAYSCFDVLESVEEERTPTSPKFLAAGVSSSISIRVVLKKK